MLPAWTSGLTPEREGRLSDVVAGGGAGQAEAVAQRVAFVTLAEDAAALQLGDDETRHVLVRAGHVGGGDDEAVARVTVEPLLHLVGNRRRGADEARPLQQG